MEKFFRIIALMSVSAALLALSGVEVMRYLDGDPGSYQLVADGASAYVLDTASGYGELFVYNGNDFQYQGQFQIGQDNDESQDNRKARLTDQLAALVKHAKADHRRSLR